MIVPAVRSLPFTKKWGFTHDPFLSKNEANRIRYVSFPQGRFPRTIRKSLSNAITGFIARDPVDLIHFNWLFPDGLAIPEAKKLGVPIVLTIHGSDWYYPQNKPTLEKMAYESLDKADLVLTVGDKLRSDILKKYPEYAPKIHVTHNAVDFKKFQPAANREDALKKVKWSPAKKHLLCVANLYPVKGVDVLVDAMIKLQSENVTLHILGNIPDTTYSSNLVRNIQSQDNITLHPPVNHDDIAAYYQACDVFVLPSRREGFGIALAEAIACGKPVVSTKSGGPQDIVTDENGLLAEPGRPDQLSEKIGEILTGKVPFDSERVRSSIFSKFNIGKITDDMIRHYQSVM